MHALAKTLEASVALLEKSTDGTWQKVAKTSDAFVLSEADRAAAVWSERYAQRAGRGTQTAAQNSRWMLPLVLRQQAHGVMAVALPQQAQQAQRFMGPERRQLALAMVHDITVALQQSRLDGHLQASQIQAETEHLPKALLSSVSHDLRSLLVSMIGAASTLVSYPGQKPAQERRQRLDVMEQ